MGRLAKINRNFDEFVFKQVDLLKSSQLSQVAQEKLAALDSKQKKIISQIGHLSVVFIPFLIGLIFYTANLQTKSELKELQVLKEKLEEYLLVKEEIEIEYKKNSPPVPLSNQDQFNSFLMRELDSQNVDSEKIKVKSLLPLSEAGQEKGVSFFKASISFNGLANSSLRALFTTILSRFHGEIKSLSFKREEKEILTGDIEFDYLDKQKQ